MSFRLTVAPEAGEAEWSANTVDYLPFGVETLKVKVGGDYRVKVRLRPRRLSAVPGEKLGHEGEGAPPQFVVSWGGGHEDYCEPEAIECTIAETGRQPYLVQQICRDALDPLNHELLDLEMAREIRITLADVDAVLDDSFFSTRYSVL